MRAKHHIADHPRSAAAAGQLPRTFRCCAERNEHVVARPLAWRCVRQRHRRRTVIAIRLLRELRGPANRGMASSSYSGFQRSYRSHYQARFHAEVRGCGDTAFSDTRGAATRIECPHEGVFARMPSPRHSFLVSALVTRRTWERIRRMRTGQNMQAWLCHNEFRCPCPRGYSTSALARQSALPLENAIHVTVSRFRSVVRIRAGTETEWTMLSTCRVPLR